MASAQRRVEQFTADQPPVEVDAIDGNVPQDITLGVITCAFPVCQAIAGPAVEAAEELGWSVQQIQNDPTPESYQAAWTQILQQDPDAILFQGAFPSDVIADQLADAAERDIPTVVFAPNTPTPQQAGSENAVAAAPAFSISGELMGDIVVGDAEGEAEALFIQEPTFAAVLEPVRAGFDSRVVPAGVNVETLDISLAEVGKGVPSQVVNYVQSHPDVEYLVFALADFTAGVPQALQAAGLADQVKIVSRAPQPTNLANIQAGAEFASVGEENAAAGYRAIDMLVRILAGGEPTDQNPAGWHRIYVEGNVSDTSTAPDPAGIPDAFYEAWGVG